MTTVASRRSALKRSSRMKRVRSATPALPRVRLGLGDAARIDVDTHRPHALGRAGPPQ